MRKIVMNTSLFMTASVFLISVCLAAPSQGIKVDIFPPNSSPYNTSYAEWSEKWWKWSLAIPEDSNPISDKTGKNCAINQEGPVWFLAGTTGGSANRECTVPSGKSILIVPLNAECSYAEFPLAKSEKELLDCAREGQNDAHLEVSIDGYKVQNLSQYRVHSGLFDVVLPERNIYGAPSGPTQAVSDGWWIISKPLTSGQHKVHFSGTVFDNPTTGTQGFSVETTYNLNIK